MTCGANRVVRGARIEHVCGDPNLGEVKDYAYGMRIINTALAALAAEVSGPTLFDPLAVTGADGADAMGDAAGKEVRSA